MSSRQTSQQHYLPAAYIGRFSFSAVGPRMRRRPVWVKLRNVDDPFVNTAEARASAPNMYSLPVNDAGDIEHIDCWRYERRLSVALDCLITGPSSMDGVLWHSTLVPFVSGLWVRAPDRNGGKNNHGRMVEYQEVLAPAMAAEWRIAESPERSLITNDRGFAAFGFRGTSAMYIPISPRHALMLTGGDRTTLLRDAGAPWTVNVGRTELSTREADVCNTEIARCALQEIYGDSLDSVNAYDLPLGAPPWSRGLPFLASPTELRCHFYDYFRMGAALRAQLGSEQRAAETASLCGADLDPDSAVEVEVLFPERTRGGVYANTHQITVCLQLGQAFMKARRAAGDFRQGNCAPIPAKYFTSLPPESPSNLGRSWMHSSRAGRGKTIVLTDGLRQRQSIDLNAWYQELAPRDWQPKRATTRRRPRASRRRS